MNRAKVREMFPEITDEQLEWVMAQNGSDVKAAKSDLQAKLDAAAAEAEEMKAQLEEFNAKRKENMTREEQLEEALEALKAQQAETQRGYNRMSAAKELGALGLAEKDLDSILDLVTTDDADETTAKAGSIAAIIRAMAEAARAEAVKKAQIDSPTPDGPAGETSMTKEEFDALTFPEKAQMFEEQPELYKALNEME